MSQSLPQQMYLLCYDTEKGKIELGTALVRGALLRATAAAELTIRGLLRDHAGKAQRTPAAAYPPQDAFLAEVLDEVPTDRPKRWFSVIFDSWHSAEDAVRDQLAATDTLTDDEGKALGLIPVHHVTLADPEQLYALRERIRNVVVAAPDPASIPIEDAVLAALACDGDVTTVLGRKERLTHRSAIKTLSHHVDNQLPGLRKGALYAFAARRAPVVS